MPYRAQMGGVFGSGLYPRQQNSGQAGEVIDAVTRGATTLIQGAYARAQRAREERLQDEEIARRDRAEQREIESTTFERGLKLRAEGRANESEARANATAGYTPARTEDKDVVEPGTVETNGVFGAPGKVSGPSITKKRTTIPGSLDYTKSTAYRARAQQHDIKETERGEHVEDTEKIHAANRKFDVDHPLPPRRGQPGSSDSPSVHAATQVRAQLNEVDQQIKTLERQRKDLLPVENNGKTYDLNKREREAVEAQLVPLKARADSLREVHDRIAGKLTEQAGVSRTITGALGAKRGAATDKQTITQAEAAELKKRGFSDAKISAKYLIK